MLEQDVAFPCSLELRLGDTPYRGCHQSRVGDKWLSSPFWNLLLAWECPHTVDAKGWEYHACIAPWKG